MLTRVLPRPDYAGGVSGQVHLLAATLQRRGCDVTVYAQNGPPPQSPYRVQCVGRPSDGAGSLRSIFLFPWHLSRLSFDDYDVVHAHGDDHLLRTKTPVVRTFYGSARGECRHASTVRRRVYYGSMVIPEVLAERRATARVAISTAMLKELTAPAHVIPCAYDSDVFSPSGVKSARPSILFVGDLGTRKRAELLLQVFESTVRPALPDAELWLVTSAGVEGAGVRWYGRVTSAALADLYRRAWVFCMPSLYEGFGVPYVEAMASGTPFVATPNGGANEVLGSTAGGWIVDDAQLGDSLVALLRDGGRRESMRVAALERVRTYEIGCVADRYLELYGRVIRAV